MLNSTLAPLLVTDATCFSPFSSCVNAAYAHMMTEGVRLQLVMIYNYSLLVATCATNIYNFPPRSVNSYSKCCVVFALRYFFHLKDKDHSACMSARLTDRRI